MNLEATAALETVTPAMITPYIGLPNEFFSSDHLSLKAYFKFATDKKLICQDELQQGAWEDGPGVWAFFYNVQLKTLSEIAFLFKRIY